MAELAHRTSGLDPTPKELLPFLLAHGYVDPCPDVAEGPMTQPEVVAADGEDGDDAGDE